jgi:XTP/dITP diphosphohydrolase
VAVTPVRLLVATTNPYKLREIRALLADADVELSALDALAGVDEPDETGSTFQENARLKALYYSRAWEQASRVPALVVGEDSGLVIDALDGEPGVRSARFLRPDASYEERFAEIFQRLQVRPERGRSARFICALAVASGGAIVFETTGTVEGEIAGEPHGTHGFGYDPIFLYPPYGRTLAEVDDEQKLRVAHRGHAFRQLSDWLRTGQPPQANPEF